MSLFVQVSAPRRRLATTGVGALMAALVFGAVSQAGGKAAAASVCGNGAWQTKATTQGNSFSSERGCLSYAASGKPLVTCTITGTRGADVFESVEVGEVVCGFGGNDAVEGWVYGTFYGGNGDDVVDSGDPNNPGGVAGTFVGGAGSDRAVSVQEHGTFIGGNGNDSVAQPNSSGLGSVAGTFVGGAGDDAAETVTPGGRFAGGEGNDGVTFLYGGTFLGGSGDDIVSDGGSLNGGVYNGGSGIDTLCLNGGLNSVRDVEILHC